jgi:hypothetical protein
MSPLLVLHFNCSTNKYISAINKATIDQKTQGRLHTPKQ